MISAIRSSVEVGADNWFEEGVRRIVGGGSSTYLWLDNWVGGAPLHVQFPRLFDLAVREMEGRGWAVDGGP